MGALAAAIRYAHRGLRVHPCAPGQKVPLLQDWPNRATLDPRTIESWWRRWPDANVGIVCGGEMRLLVVDLDPDAGGESAFADLEREHGAMPPTMEAVTPRGGRHIYLLVPNGRQMPGNSAGKLAEGVDTRGRHGSVLAPPSMVNGRPYRWSVDSSDRIAEAPAWLLELLEADTGGAGRATSPEVWRKLVEGVEAGARNHTIARLAGLLLRRLPDPLVAAQLVLAFNEARCHPPLPIEEVQRTLDSIASREMKRRGLAP